MSWLTDIAGRAEDLLNKIDQNAGVILEKNNKKEANSTNNGHDIDNEVEIVVDSNHSVSYNNPVLPLPNIAKPKSKLQQQPNQDEELIRVKMSLKGKESLLMKLSFFFLTVSK